MTREEFEQRCADMKPEAGPVLISDEEYALIEKVYTFHPSISETEGKNQIAYLYRNFGMSIIRDMEPRAEVMKFQEEKLRRIRAELEETQDFICSVRNGGEI